MLRQANDQLERTMTERQELEDSVKQANEETTAKVKLISDGFGEKQICWQVKTGWVHMLIGASYRPF